VSQRRPSVWLFPRSSKKKAPSEMAQQAVSFWFRFSDPITEATAELHNKLFF